MIDTSIVRGQYENAVDRDSAYEMLKKRTESAKNGDSTDQPKGKESKASTAAKAGAAVVFGRTDDRHHSRHHERHQRDRAGPGESCAVRRQEETLGRALSS